MAFEVHPLAELIPPMTDEEYRELREDIEAHGLLEPITLYEGKVLDGRHRARACDELGIETRTFAYNGDSPASYVVSLNVRRRQLTLGQRSMIAVALLPHLEAEASRRREAGLRRGTALAPAESPSVSIATDGAKPAMRAAAQAGALVGVSGGSVAKAKRVISQRPDLAEMVRAAKMTVDGANTIIREGEAADRGPKPNGYVINSERQYQIAAKARERLGVAISSVMGTANGLEGFKLDAALAVSDEDEMHEWVQMLDESMRALGRLRSEIRGRL